MQRSAARAGECGDSSAPLPVQTRWGSDLHDGPGCRWLAGACHAGLRSRPHHMPPILNAHFWMHYTVYRPASHARPAMLYPATAYEQNLMLISVCASYKFGFLPHYILPQFMDHFHCMQLHVCYMQVCLPPCHCPSTFLYASFLLACPPVCHIITQAAFVVCALASICWMVWLSVRVSFSSTS